MQREHGGNRALGVVYTPARSPSRWRGSRSSRCCAKRSRDEILALRDLRSGDRRGRLPRAPRARARERSRRAGDAAPCERCARRPSAWSASTSIRARSRPRATLGARAAAILRVGDARPRARRRRVRRRDRKPAVRPPGAPGRAEADAPPVRELRRRRRSLRLLRRARAPDRAARRAVLLDHAEQVADRRVRTPAARVPRGAAQRRGHRRPRSRMLFDDADAFPCIVWGTVGARAERIRSPRRGSRATVQRRSRAPSASRSHAHAGAAEPWHIEPAGERALLDRLEARWPRFGDLVARPARGVVTGCNRAFVIDRSDARRAARRRARRRRDRAPAHEGPRPAAAGCPQRAERYVILLVDRGTSLEELPHVLGHLAQFRAVLEPDRRLVGCVAGPQARHAIAGTSCRIPSVQLAKARTPRLFYQDIQTEPVVLHRSLPASSCPIRRCGCIPSRIATCSPC